MFGPIIGEVEAQRLENELLALFSQLDSESGPMISGFLALKAYGENGEVDSQHITASLITLIQVREQLEATADVIEFE